MNGTASLTFGVWCSLMSLTMLFIAISLLGFTKKLDEIRDAIRKEEKK